MSTLIPNSVNNSPAYGESLARATTSCASAIRVDELAKMPVTDKFLAPELRKQKFDGKKAIKQHARTNDGETMPTQIHREFEEISPREAAAQAGAARGTPMQNKLVQSPEQRERESWHAGTPS